MDWCIDTRVAGAVDVVVGDVVGHLRRHAEVPEVVALSEPLVREALAGEGGAPMRWLSLDWDNGSARVAVAQLVDGVWPGQGATGSLLTTVAPGVARADEATSELWNVVRAGPVSIDLPVVRAPERNLDPIPIALTAAPASREQFLVESLALLLAPATDAPDAEEQAATVGASIGNALGRALPQPPRSPRELAEVIANFERTMGGDFFVIDADERTAVLGNHRCPFGDTVRGAPALCRLTSALAGRLGANALGPVSVSLPERLAVGDHQCRLVIDLDAGQPDRIAHQYGAPAAGLSPSNPPATTTFTRGLQVTLSLRLPRDELSVPFVRRLVRHALVEVGVIDDDQHAVELVLTEAAANVVQHSGPGDLYDVNVEINPVACEIRVIDIGRGFDHERLDSAMAKVSAEEGRGIALMRALMDQVHFGSHPERGTIVHLVKRLHFDDRAPARALMLRMLRQQQV